MPFMSNDDVGRLPGSSSRREMGRDPGSESIAAGSGRGLAETKMLKGVHLIGLPFHVMPKRRALLLYNQFNE
jgi:hypothetical protein